MMYIKSKNDMSLSLAPLLSKTRQAKLDRPSLLTFALFVSVLVGPRSCDLLVLGIRSKRKSDPAEIAWVDAQHWCRWLRYLYTSTQPRPLTKYTRPQRLYHNRVCPPALGASLIGETVHRRDFSLVSSARLFIGEPLSRERFIGTLVQQTFIAVRGKNETAPQKFSRKAAK